MKSLFFFILVCLFSFRSFALVSSLSSTFSPADSTRSYMDIGGVWDGTSNVTTLSGDTFGLVISNTGSGETFDLSPSVSLPAEFTLVGTPSILQTGTGCLSSPSVVATQTAQVINFELSSYDLPEDCSLTILYGLTTSVAATSGTFSLTSSLTFATSEGGAQGAALTDVLNVSVNQGLTTIKKTPGQQSKAVGETASFKVSLCNTGNGGLFDVTIDESYISPTNPEGSLSLTSMTQTAPSSPLATGAAPVLTLPYLAPGECFEVDVESTVSGCAGIDNEVASTDLTGATATSVTANVKLNLTTPLVDYLAPTINVPATGKANISFNVENTGLGSANGLVLTFADLPSNILVSNVSGNWTWDATAKTFTATSAVANGAVEVLSFDVEKVGSCPPAQASSGSYLLAAAYTDGCGNPYTVPFHLGAYFIAGVSDPFSITKNVSSNGGSSSVPRINIGEPGTWTLNFAPGSPADVALLNTDPVVVTDTLPSGPTAYSLGSAPSGTTANCSGSCVGGSTVTWTIPKSAMTGALSLEVGFTAPTDPCAAGGVIANTMETSYTYTSEACADSQSSDVSFYVTNTVGSTGSASQSYNVSNALGNASVSFETGLNDDGDLIEEHESGEGDHIYYTNAISFPAAFVGEWLGSEYRDNIGNLSASALVSGSLTVTSSDFVGAAVQAVPGAAIGFSPGNLVIDLDFLQGPSFFNNNSVAGKTLELKYAVTINNSEVLPGIERSVLSVGVFEIANTASGGGCGLASSETFSQAVGYDVFRRQSLPSVSLPASIQICEPFDVTLSSTKYNSPPFGWDPRLVLNEGSYKYVHPQTPTLGGFFTSSNMTYNDNGGLHPEWTATSPPLEQSSVGTVAFKAVLPAGSSTSPVPLSMALHYDDTQELSNGGLFFSEVASDSPTLVREGNLSITTTPSVVTVLGEQIRFSIYVTNGGAGTAFNTYIEDSLPAAFSPNQTDTNAANSSSYPVGVAGQTMTWSLGDLAPGETKEIVLVADVNGSSCSLPTGSNTIEAKWGCGSPFVDHEVETSHLPNFNFPTAQVQVLHDVANTQVAMCDSDNLGKDIITIKNAGITTVKNAFLEEVLNPALTGIDLLPATAEVSLNGGAWTATADPSGAGTAASPYRWDATAVSELLTLEPGDEVSIRFDIGANESVSGTTPSITVDGGGELTCGTSVAAPSPSTFNIRLLEPDMSLTKVGRNLTTGGPFSETVYARPSDEVEWQIVVSNSGGYTAKTLELRDDFPNTGGPDGVLNGPGHSATNFPDASTETLPNINSSSNATYTLRQTMGSTCVDAVNTASIKWGCTAPASVTSPSDNSDTANLVMNPTFSSAGGSLVQSFQSRNNGRMNVRLVATNGGAYAQNLVLSNTLPAGFEIDPSFTASVSSTGAVTSVALSGTATLPVFTFTGTLGNAESLTLDFRIIQSSNFDANSDPLVNPETVANTLDPPWPATAPNTMNLTYENGCGNSLSDSSVRDLNSRTPDLDISVSPSSQVVSAGSTYTFTFRITNAGESGSVAEAIEFTPILAAGWTATSVSLTTSGSGGSGGLCSGTCTAAQIGTLSHSAFAEIEVTGTAQDNGSPLEVVGRVLNRNVNDSGLDTGGVLSNDEARPKIIGYSLDKTLVSTNESFTSDPNVGIGEEVTWNLSASWFGLSGSETVGNIVARDRLPVSLGYVSHINQAGNSIAYTFSGPSPVSSGTLDYTFASLASPGGSVDVNVVSRVLNVGLSDADVLVNNFGLSFDYLGQTFASNNGTDGFGGSEPELHVDLSLTASVPQPTFVKEVRNVTQGGSFGSAINAEADEEVEYRIQIENTGNAPLFDLLVNDTLDGKLNLIDAASDGINNDGNGAPEGTFTPGLGGTLVFNHANTGLTSGSSLERLDPGNTITLLYRATVNASAHPSERLSNSASLEASTLPGANGNQSAPLGTSGALEGEQIFNLTSVAYVDVEDVSFAKTIESTSVGGDTNANLVIGEQVDFALDIVLPASTVPNFNVTDDVPAGMRLVSSPTLNLNSTSCPSPTVTPTAPSSGAFSLNFNFGTCNVPSGLTEAQRTVSIRYTLQVENVSGNVSSSSLVNRARYTFTGFSSPNSSLSMTVQEPNISVFTKTASPASGLDAGDEVTYRVVLSNTGPVTAYDLNIVDQLDSNTEYIASSTNTLGGPSMTEPSLSLGVLTWGRERSPAVTLDLASGQTLEFTYRVRLLNAVEPGEKITNSVEVNYTSLPGDPGPDLGSAVGAAGTSSGERTGSGTGQNTYRALASEEAEVQNTTSLAKTSSGDPLLPSGFRIGDLITYTLEMELQEGTSKALSLLDTLPSGLKFYDTVSLLPASSTGTGSINYASPTGPTAGDTSLSWNFGTVVVDGDNSASNNKLTLVYRAVIVDAGGLALLPSTQSLNNAANLSYQLESGATTSSNTAVDTIEVKQPLLSIEKTLTGSQPSEIETGATVYFTIKVSNTGTAPSYNIVVTDILPEEMRDNAPSFVSATLNGNSLALGAPTWNPGTGLATWSLGDSDVLNAGSDFVINYQATVDSDVGAGRSFANSARVEASFSLPSSTTSTERRGYAPSTASSAGLTTAAPSDMAKAQNHSVANIGEIVTYTLRVPETAVPSVLYDVNVSDALPSGLEIVSVNTNAGTLGVGLSNSSTSTALALEFDRLPKNSQAVVSVQARVQNVIGNQSATSLQNTASYTWAGTDGGSQEASIQSPTRELLVSEPNLSFVKTFKSQTVSDSSIGLQTGDTVTYTIRVENTGDGDAHDLILTDRADENLINPSVAANPDNPGLPANSGTVGGFTTWTWNLPGSLVAKTSGVYQFDVTFTLGSDVRPYMNLENSGGLTYTSAAGVVLGERDGSGGLNDYIFNQTSPVTVQTGNIKLNKRLKTPSLTTYGIGSEVTFELVAEFGLGKVDAFYFVDALPVGMEFVSASLTSSNVQRQSGGSPALLNSPSAGATGSLSFEIGDIESSGSSPHMILEIVARLQDLSSNAEGLNLTNTASAQLKDPDDGSTVTINGATSASVEVVEPDLRLNFDGPTNVDLGAEADFQVRVLNQGRQPAYQPKIEVELPSGLREADPTSSTLVVSISGGRNLTLTSASDYSAVYNAGTGRLVVSLTSSQAFVDENEILTLDFKVQADSGASTSTGSAYQVVATVSEFGSQDRSSGTVPENRIDATAFGSGSVGTANATNGDDQNDDHNFDVRAPELVITKSVSSTTVAAGAALSYTVSIVNSGAIDALITSLSDDMSESFEAGSLTLPVVTGASPGSVTFDANGGVHSTGTWTVSNLSVPNTGLPVEVSFSVQAKRPLASGTQIFNQAVAEVEGYTTSFVSDSENASDDDGTETGNDAGDPNDDDPVLTTVVSAPDIRLLKNSSVSSPPLVAGGEITYTITASNLGNENLINAVLQDAIPANTTYVENSTYKDPNGSPTLIPDVGGTSALVSGLSINASLANTLEVDQMVEYSFKVRVKDSVNNGTVISNQAFISGEGEGSGALSPLASDDPDTTFGPDPAQDIVGEAPSLYAIKSVSDLNGGSLVGGDVLRYSIVVRNNGSTAMENLELNDVIPANTTFVAGSMTYDDDNLGPNVPLSISDALDGDVGSFDGTALSFVLGSLSSSTELKIEFDVLVDPASSTGTVISNTGMLSAEGLPETYTDSDSNPANGSQSTDIIVGDRGLLRVTKEVADANGGSVEPGDDLIYTLRVRNIGTQTATGVVITDPMPTPASVAYILGTTKVNSLSQTDVLGQSPLVAGLNLGDLAANSLTVISYRVSIPLTESLGTIIKNQASYTSTDAGSGLSDSDRDDGIESGNDASNPNDDDPSEVQIGGAPGVASVSGRVWQDIDHDRLIGGTEPLAEGWTVEILLGNILVGTATTDAQGQWSVNGLAPGPGYTVRFRHPTSGNIFGGADSNEPGVDLSTGAIKSLTLPSGLTVLDQNLPLDPSGRVYDSVSRRNVGGAKVSLLGPLGFDPLTQTLQGLSEIVTADDGFYRYDLDPSAPAGEYRLVVTVPPGYLPNVSSLIAPAAATCDPLSVVCNPGSLDPFTVALSHEAPSASGGDTTYYLTFILDPSNVLSPDVVNNHIPIDPILKGAISVQKTASKKNVTTGGFSNYNIRVENTLNVSLGNLDVEDILPPGFIYAPGSSLVGGVSLEPEQDGRTLKWKNQTFAANEVRNYKIATVVGASVQHGRSCNEAQVRQNIVDEVITDVSKACVRVVPDPTFDCPDLIGKVFDDKNKNGYQDKGEEGLPGVKVITTKGWVVSSDHYGRYHIACPIQPNVDRGSNFAIKVDSSTLPTGYRLTTENPKVVRLTRGKVSKANFGASVHRLIGIDLKDEAYNKKGYLEKKWLDALPKIIKILSKSDSVVRITYESNKTENKEIKKRIKNLKVRILEECKKNKVKNKILFEDFIYKSQESKGGAK